jgi:glycerol-3-phosphate cytidylyltransferase-like family protein
LAVIVHADEHIERFKGYTPEPLEDRLADLRDLRTVDAVLAGDGRSKAAWAKLLGADVIFVGPETVRAPWAGTTVWLPRTPGISSTLLRQREGGSA